MKMSKQYKVRATIKLHTSPLRELTYEKIGTLIKESKAFYIFNGFRVKKSTVISIQEVLV